MSSRVRILGILCILSGAALTGGFGIQYLVRPESVREVAGLAPETAAALAEVRSTYGGLHVGIAAFLVACAASERRRPVGLLFCGLAFAGAGLARVAGILEFRPDEPGQTVVAALELAFSAISLLLWRAWRAA